MRRYAKALESIERGYLRQPRRRPVRHRKTHPPPSARPAPRTAAATCSEPVIVLAHDLTPSETAVARSRARSTPSPPRPAAGPATPPSWPASWKSPPWSASASSSPTSPAATWSSSTATAASLILNPDEETLERYEQTAQQLPHASRARLDELRDLPAETRDGVRVAAAAATSSSRRRRAHCLDRGADGVGLYRTEFLYLGKQTDPTEAEHLEAYLTVLRDAGAEAAGGHPHARSGGRQVPAARRNRPSRSAIRSWACAACGCVCGI